MLVKRLVACIILAFCTTPAFAQGACSKASDLVQSSYCDKKYRTHLPRDFRSVYFPRNLKFSDECGLRQDGAGGYLYAHPRTDNKEQLKVANFRSGPAKSSRLLFSETDFPGEVYSYHKGWFLVSPGAGDGRLGWVHGSNLILSPLAPTKARACLGIPANFPQAK